MIKFFAKYFWNKIFFLNLFIFLITFFFFNLIKINLVKNHIDIYEIKFPDNYFFVNTNLDIEKDYGYKLISNKNRDILNSFKIFENRLKKSSCFTKYMQFSIDGLKEIFPFYVNYSNFSPSVMLDNSYIKYFNNIIYSHLHKPKQYTLNGSLLFEIRNSFEAKNKFNNNVQMGIKKQLEIFNLTYGNNTQHKNNLLYQHNIIGKNKKNYFSINFHKKSTDFAQNQFKIEKKNNTINLKDHIILISYADLFKAKDYLFYNLLLTHNIFDNSNNKMNYCLLLNKKILELYRNINLTQDNPKFQVNYISSNYEQTKNNFFINILILLFSFLIFLIFRISNKYEY